MSELRVLEAITPSRLGGAEVFAASFCDELARLAVPFTLFSPSGRPFVTYAAGRGLECVSWKTHGKIDPVTIIRLARLIKRERISVVHTHLSTASLLGALAAKFAGVPSVAHVHGMNTATCFRYSTAVIAVSEAVAKHLCAQGLDRKRIRVIHNGVDVERFEPAPLVDAKRARGIEPSAPVFGVFGRLSEEKGQRVAIEALFILSKTRPDARLLLAGDGKDREDLAKAADALGISGSVEFVGFQRDIRPLMAACDAVIVPSLKEGFGLAAVEAMAMRRPVIASAVGGLPEIVVPGETGYLVAPNDPNATAQALSEIVEQPESAERMGAKARERVEQSFGFRAQAREVLDVLASCAT